MTDYVKEVAVTGLVVLEVAALSMGINGVLFSAVICLIAGIAGYKISDYIRGETK